ncbi:hypothetical protein DT076_01990 [Desertihabitans brevis]|uniref:Uncharacterized protein n=1 Tax=Desertihabitans brevis TaxID=2268447 RepID=A0A367YZG9_9ACTN|nr:hypothetical protein [Desertihabitans brevis]RCK71244.1 hypothetical protein DT076_01990 [Desertihabitans brevis]
MTARRLAAAYLAAQGVAVGLWWALLALRPDVRALFELGDPALLDAYLPPDVVLGLASLAAARLVTTAHPAAPVLTGLVLGAVGYGTAMTVGQVLGGGQGWLGLLAMAAATAATAVCLRVVARREVETT